MGSLNDDGIKFRPFANTTRIKDTKEITSHYVTQYKCPVLHLIIILTSSKYEYQNKCICLPQSSFYFYNHSLLDMKREFQP